MGRSVFKRNEMDHLLQRAVPGPYHVVKAWDGEAFISGAPDRVVTNEATIELAVLLLEKCRREADAGEDPATDLLEARAEIDELEGQVRELVDSRNEAQEGLDEANREVKRLRKRIEEMEDAARDILNPER